MVESGILPRPIGGFFGLGVSDVPLTSGSIWQSWVGSGRVTLAAWTARAALAQLIVATNPNRVWLPAYVCRELASATPKSMACFYPMNRECPSPEIQFLRDHVRTGDMVVAVDYFGWPPCSDFIEFVTERPEVIWVEDRAHCLWTAQPPWAQWLLYSPRKLIGVPDGGILIAPAEIAEFNLNGSVDVSWALPELMRFEDVEEADNAAWYRVFKAREARLSAEPIAMSQLSMALLQRIPLSPLVEARQGNYAYLMQELGAYAAWRFDALGTAPFGFVISVADAERVAEALARERIFCPLHWAPANLPSDPAEFAWEHRLAGRLLTLPCDHRYDHTTLAHLVAAVLRIAQPLSY